MQYLVSSPPRLEYRAILLDLDLEYRALLLVLLHWVVGGSAVDLTNQIKKYLKQKY